jgi:tetratricopeptide (TPR) repeat protein
MRKLLLIGTCLVALTGAAQAAADTDWKKTPVEKACTDTPLAELTDAQRIDGISACTRAIASTSNPNALSTLYAWRAELYTQLHGCATDPTQKGPPASSCEYDRAIADYAKAIENLLRVDDGYAARFLSNLKGWLEFMKVDVNAATRSFAYAAGGKYDRSSTFWLARSYYEKGDLANARVQFSKALKDGKPEDEVKYLAQSKEYLARIERKMK